MVAEHAVRAENAEIRSFVSSWCCHDELSFRRPFRFGRLQFSNPCRLAGGDPRASAVQGSLDQSLDEGCRHADKVFGNHNSAGTACALVQSALRRESDASHVDTTSAGALACTNRALMSEIQAIWVNFEREADSPNC